MLCKKHIKNSVLSLLLVAGMIIPCHNVYAANSTGVYLKPGTDPMLDPSLISDTEVQKNLKYDPSTAILDSWKDIQFTAVSGASSDNDESRLLTYSSRFKIALLHYMSPGAIPDTEVQEAIAFTTDEMKGTYSAQSYLLQDDYTDSPITLPDGSTVQDWDAVAINMAVGDSSAYNKITNGPYFAYFYSSAVNSDTDGEAFDFLANLIFEYHYYYSNFRLYVKEQLDSTGTVDGTTWKGLKELKSVAEINEELCPTMKWTMFPIISLMWEYDPDGNGSLKDIYSDAEQVANTIETGATPEYNKEYSQPLTDFYTVTYTKGVASIDLLHNPVDYVTLSDNIHRGIAYSATYIPMQTNLYSPVTINKYDADFRDNFHYKYGFMRKALLKDISATSAVDYYNSSGSTHGTLKVCTLRDFLELGDNDLTLYLDDNFYNADEAKTIVQDFNEQYTERMQAAVAQLSILTGDLLSEEDCKDLLDEEVIEYYQSISYLVGSGIGTLSQSDLRNLQGQITVALHASDVDSWESKIKTDNYSQYSSSIRDTLKSIQTGDFRQDANSEDFLLSDNYDSLVLSSYYIKDYLDCTTTRVEDEDTDSDVEYEYTSFDEYTPMLSYAYVSALYRDSLAFKIANAVSGLETPVFMASDDLCSLNSIEQYYANSLLNYALVHNLKSMTQVSSDYVTDLDAPVFMDIYGNIVTESGTVIIPAACNATLYYDDFYKNNTALGLYSCYGKDYYVPASLAGAVNVLSPYFSIDDVNSIWTLDSVEINVNGYVYNLNNLALYTDSTLDATRDAFASYLNQTSAAQAKSHCLWTSFVNIINEVMRGAPIESIDYVKENLETSNNTTAGKIAATKLEALINSISSSNAMFSLPDVNSVDHLDYYIAFGMKLLVILTVIVVIITVFLDGVANQLGWRTLKSILGSVILTFVVLTALPALFQLTYYTSNKLLLQNEVTRLAIYNLEKSYSGVEIGTSEVTIPNNRNKLMVQLDWVDVPWYDELDAILFGSSINAVTHVKEDAFTNSLVSNQPDVTLYNDGVYMGVDDIFDSVNIDYTFYTSDDAVNGLYLNGGSEYQTLSFYSPYYVFLNALLTNINNYNQVMGSYNYSTKLQSGNKLKTVGLCQDYFTSQAFMEYNYDIMHLNEVFQTGISAGIDTPECFTAEDIARMSESLWYVNLDSDNLDTRINTLDNYCRDYIAKNRDLLDKVSDETFIKVMALAMAMKYNQIFGISSANCFEIQNVDYNDLLRLCMAQDSDAMLTSPMSYARFVYALGDEPAVYGAAVLTMVMFVGSYIKPICTILAFLSLVLNVFVTKVVMRKKFSSARGYIITSLLLCGINIFHAVLLKLSTLLPGLGLPMLGCIIFLIFFQVIYLLCLSYITGITLAYWQDLGEAKYSQQADSIRRRFGKDTESYLSGNLKHHDDNWQYYQDLVEQHRERSRH